MKRSLIIMSLIVGVRSSYSQKLTNLQINESAPVLQKNEILINAEPEEIWEVLTDIRRWPHWNTKISNIHVPRELVPNSNFTWKTNGNTIRSEVHTMIRNQSFGWKGRTFGARAVHNWYLESTGRGTIVRVEESMNGWLIVLMKKKMNSILKDDMAYWLKKLKEESEK